MTRFNSTYGFLRPQCPSPTIAAASGGNLSAGSLWFGIVRQNRIGFDIPSTLQQVTWTNGQKIVITLPSPLRVNDSEDVQRIWVIAAATNTPAQTQAIACWRGYQLVSVGGGYYAESRNSLPATIELTESAQIALGAVSANPTALTGLTDLKDGHLRFVTSLNKTFLYDPVSTQSANGLTVLAASPNPGKWVQWWFPDTFSIGSITDTTGDRGANKDTRATIDADVILPPPRYKMDGTNSTWVQYTLFNGLTESGTVIEAGTRVRLDVYQSGAIRSQLFSGRVVFKLLGVVRFSDGSISTSGITANIETPVVYGDPCYTLEADLQPGYGLSFAIAFKFNRAELDGDVQVGALSVRPYFSQQSGVFYPGYRLTGDLIYNLGDLRRIFPKRGAIARIGQGAGVIKRLEFDLRSAGDLTIPSTGVTDQKITVNSNGDVFWRGSADLLASEVLRAVVGLRTGRSNPSAWSSYTAYSATDSIQVAITYPTDIRSNYPDVIANAGVSKGVQFNAPFVAIYIQRQSDGQIREFSNNATLATGTQTFTISDFTAGTVIGSLPTTVGDFGCFESSANPTVTTLPGGGSIGSASYRVAYAFRYDGTTLTDISHSTSVGCVGEFVSTLGTLGSQIATLSTAIAAWQNGSASIDVLNGTIRGNLEARGALNLWADLLTLNQDAAGSGADWRYGLQRPATGMTAHQTVTLPPNQGQAEQAIVGDGAGAWQFASVIRNRTVTLNFNSASTVAWFTLLAGDYLRLIEVLIVTAFNGTTPLLSIGISGNTGKYGGSSTNDLKATAGSLFRLPNRQNAPGSDEPLILSYTADSSSVGQAIVIAHYFG